MRYVTVPLSLTLLLGQGAGNPPSNHDVIDGEVGGGGSFHLETSGHT